MPSDPVTAPSADAPLSDATESLLTTASLQQPFLTRVIDRVLAQLRHLLNEALFQHAAKWALLGGEGLFYIAVLGYLLLVTIAGIKADSIAALGIAWGWGLASIAFAYVGLKIIPACKHLIHSTPTRVASSTLLDCVAFLCLVGILGLLIAPFFSIRSQSLDMVVAAFAVCWLGIVVLFMLAVLALNPRLLNIAIEPGASAGEEFLGLLSFLTKGSVAVLPLTFALSTVLTSVLLLVAAFLEAKGLMSSANFSDVIEAQLSIATAGSALWAVVCQPIILGLLFLLYHLFLDLCRAILAIPTLRDSPAK